MTVSAGAVERLGRRRRDVARRAKATVEGATRGKPTIEL
jgi:hypothetical protein